MVLWLSLLISCKYLRLYDWFPGDSLDLSSFWVGQHVPPPQWFYYSLISQFGVKEPFQPPQSCERHRSISSSHTHSLGWLGTESRYYRGYYRLIDSRFSAGCFLPLDRVGLDSSRPPPLWNVCSDDGSGCGEETKLVKAEVECWRGKSQLMCVNALESVKFTTEETFSLLSCFCFMSVMVGDNFCWIV